MLGYAAVSEVPLSTLPSAAGPAALTLVADPGAYVLTGAAATLSRAIQLNAEPASYSLTGFAATMVVDRSMIAGPGTYVITGADADLTVSSGAARPRQAVRRLGLGLGLRNQPLNGVR